jgi:hypothetical protein
MSYGFCLPHPLWCCVQVDKALGRAADARAPGAGGDYDLVLDEDAQVDFVMETTLAGDTGTAGARGVGAPPGGKGAAAAAALTEQERKRTRARGSGVTPPGDRGWGMAYMPHVAGGPGLDIQMVRQSLPTFAYRDELLDAIARFQARRETDRQTCRAREREREIDR